MKSKSHTQVRLAVNKGELVKPDICEECGAADCRIIGHHTDYKKPLKVIWLCDACHRKKHIGPKVQIEFDQNESRRTFWTNIDKTCSWLSRLTCQDYPVHAIAKEVNLSDVMIYLWGNPNKPQIPNLKQFLTAIKITGNYIAIQELARACGFTVFQRDLTTTNTLKELLRAFDD